MTSHVSCIPHEDRSWQGAEAGPWLGVGIRLLQAMGWRQGKGVGPSRAASDSASKGRWGPEAGIAAENTPIYALPPKTDTHGLGFDPFKVNRLNLDWMSMVSQHLNYLVLRVIMARGCGNAAVAVIVIRISYGGHLGAIYWADKCGAYCLNKVSACCWEKVILMKALCGGGL